MRDICKVSDQRQTKLDAKGAKCLFLGYCEGTKAYGLICLETKKIIKSSDMVFFEDKSYLEDCPTGNIDKAPAVKVDISAKSEVDESEANGDDPLEEVNKEPDIEEEDAEANIPPTKSTRSAGTSKLNHGKKSATKALHHRKMTIKLWAILGIRIGHANCLGNGGRNTFRRPKIKSMQAWQP